MSGILHRGGVPGTAPEERTRLEDTLRMEIELMERAAPKEVNGPLGNLLLEVKPRGN
jgi:hypothetical protein